MRDLDRVVMPHGTKSLSVADIPWMLAWARMPFPSLHFGEEAFESLRQGYHDGIEQAFIKGNFEGMSLNDKNKDSVFEQMLDSVKSLDEWEKYFSRMRIEVVVGEPSSSTGRYVLTEAAKKISDATNELKSAVYDCLAQAMLDGSLPVYPLGSKLRYYPKSAYNTLPQEVYWDDLNKWLDSNQPHLDFRFPLGNPMSDSTAETSSKHSKYQWDSETETSKLKARVRIIGDAAKDMFPDPMNIHTPGKSKLRDFLCDEIPGLFTNSTFDKAWKVARNDNLVEMKDSQIFKTGRR